MTHRKHIFLLIPILMIVFHPVFTQAAKNTNPSPLINALFPDTQNSADNSIRVVESNITTYNLCTQKRAKLPGTNCRQINATSWELYWNVKEGDACNTDICYQFNEETMKTCKFTWKENIFICIANKCQDGYKVDDTSHLCVIDTNINCKDKLQSSESEGVETAHYVADNNNKPVCKVTTCIANKYELKEGTCQAKTTASDGSTALQQELEKAINDLTTEFQTKVSQLQNDGGDK